ncbi:hypothetical protein ACVWXQ_006530 [Bradyrhizobium sp. S3.14.4]
MRAAPTAVMPRLDRGIQYAAAYRFNHNRLGVLGRPVKPGDDIEIGAALGLLPPIPARPRIALPVLLRRAVGHAGTGFAGGGGGELELLQEDRPGEIIALRVADLGRGLEIGQLLVGFEAFGDHGHPERFAQGFDRAQDALAARTLMDVGDERAVDLDLVGGDVGERRERGIAGAEIVDGDADAELAEHRQDLGL